MLLFIVLALPTAFPIFMQLFVKTSVDMQFFTRLMQLRRPWHSFPFGMGYQWIQLAICIILFIIARKYLPEKNKDRNIMIMVYGMIPLCIIGTIFSEWIPIQFIILTSLFQCTFLLTVFTGAYLANYIYLDTNNIGKFIIHVMLLAGLLLLGIEWHRVGLVLIGLFIIYFFIFKYIIFKIKIDSTKFVTILTIVLLVMILILPLIRPKNNTLEDWKKAEEWTGKNTQPQDMIMTPPELRGFRTYSKRCIFLDFGDIGEPIYSPQCLPMIKERLDVYKIDFSNYGKYDPSGLSNDMKKKYYSWSIEDFLSIAPKYNIKYIVYEKPYSLKLLSVYENEHYIIYKLPSI
jgi:hypothetical protein